MEGTSLNKRRIGEATLETLRKRGLIDNISDPQGVSNLSGGTLYCGFDPTARSLHIGNLVPFMLMMQLARAGADIAPIVILGGATGSIGDPSGRSQERNLLSLEEVNKNTKHIEQQFLKLAASAGQKITVLNNYDWTHTLSVLDFLRDVGKYFPVNYMLQKETVKTRLDGDGFSFTEFSYMLLQAYDFLHLHQNYNCRLQVGGSDQWGNITAGLELVRRKLQGGEVYAMSTPLLLDSQGRKLGKSFGNGLWLDPEMVSPFQFHQFFLNTDDQEALRFLRVFTFLTLEEIDSLAIEMQKAPESRVAQRRLADEVTKLVHGEAALSTAQRGAKVLFGGSLDDVSDAELLQVFRDVPSSERSRAELSALGIVDLFAATGLCKSKSDVRRLITSGGAYCNNQRISSQEQKTAELLSADRKVLVLRAGKKNYHLVNVV